MLGLRVRATAAPTSAGVARGLAGPPWWGRTGHLGVEAGRNLGFVAVVFADFVQVVPWHLGRFALNILFCRT